MDVTGISSGVLSSVAESLVDTLSAEKDSGELDEKMKEMQAMMGHMEELNKAMLKTLYMQIFLAPEEKLIEW